MEKTAVTIILLILKNYYPEFMIIKSLFSVVLSVIAFANATESGRFEHRHATAPSRGMPKESNAVTKVDICVYGGTSAGVMAAYTAKRMGKTVLLIEPGKHLGGLSSGGLGYTDIGNKFAISGLALDFYRRIGQHYGKFEQWIFEPRVAENLFKE